MSKILTFIDIDSIDFTQEALSSWQAYQENGRYLTGKEVRAWILGWGTPEEKEAPDMQSPMPSFGSDEEAGQFVESANLYEYDLSEFKVSRFEDDPESTD